MVEDKKNQTINPLDMIESLTDGIWEWRIDISMSYFSPTWKKKLGYENDEIIDEFNSWEKLIHLEDIDYVIQNLNNYLSKNMSKYEVEYRIRTKDGAYKWVLDRGKATWNDNGEPIYMVGIHTDIHYRKLAEEALKESEIKYRTLINLSPDAIFVHCKGKIIFSNEKGAELLGIHDPLELYNESVWRFIPKEEVRATKKKIDEVNIRKDNIPLREQKIIRNGGPAIDVEMSSVLISYNGHDAILTTMRDITERKKLEEDLKRTLKENKNLLQKTLENDKLKTDFFASISHELKTPLNVILGGVQLIQQLNSMSKISTECSNYNNLRKYTNMMKQNCYRLSRLINNLIDITKIDMNYINLDLKNHNIITIIEDIAMSVADYLNNKDIKLIFDTEIEERIIACDEDKIERIFLNLLSNAIKYTETNGNIYVNVYDKKDRVTISVKDTGIGIPEDRLNIIFERFRQVDSLMTRKREGSGVGLSIVKGLVEAHGGTINVVSDIDKGTEFIVELPANIIDDRLDVYTEVECTKEEKLERINIEFSDIYQ